ncbi:MAG: tetratricopeptide repeat protein [Phycisphaerales bacterium]
MAARVNVKFVIVLSIVLLGAMGAVVWAAMTIVMKSGEDHANRAVEFQQNGNWVEAQKSWAKAVNHDPSRLDWLEGWRTAIETIDYPTSAEYIQEYAQLRRVLEEIAKVKGADLDAHEEALSSTFTWLSSMRPSLEGLNEMDRVSRSSVTGIVWPDEDTPKRLMRYRARYGGRLFASGADLPRDRVETIEQDLLNAIEVDPGDIASLTDLYSMRSRQAQIALRDRREAEAERILDEARGRVLAAAEANPESLRAAGLALAIRIEEELEQVGRLQLFGGDMVAARRGVLDKHREEVEALLARHAVGGPEPTDSETTSLLMQLALRTMREDGSDAVSTLWNTAASNRPTDVLVLSARAEFLKRLNRYGDAIEAYKQIAKLERPPVSAEGVVLVQQQQLVNWKIADAAIDQWRSLPAQAPTRDQWLADAREFRERAAGDLAEDSIELTLLDAKLAFANGDFNAADRLIRQFNTRVGESDPDSVRLAAEIARRLNNTGEQRRLLYRALELNPADVQALLPLSDIAAGLRDYEEAESLLERAADILPENEAIRTRLATMRALSGNTEVGDPVQQALIDAQLADDAGNTDRAVEVLEAALADNPDLETARLHIPLAAMLNKLGRFERAAEVATAGLALEPESAILTMMQRQATVGEDATLAEQVLDDSDLPEWDKWLRKHRVRLSVGEQASASEAIARALALAPDNREVLLAAFEDALRRGDTEAARTIARDHADKDLDGAGGLVLRGRISIAEERWAEAERALLEATERGSLSAVTLRLLAQVQLQRGNSLGAIDNYSRALEIRPNDVDLISGYLQVLASTGRLNEALETARDALEFARRDERFREIWLELEGASGSKQLAYDERMKIRRTEPDNQQNTVALIDLAIDLRLFDEARRLLDEARGERDSLALAQLDARWHADRNDFEGAVKQFTDFLVSDTPGANSPNAYIAFSAFLMQRGQIERALTTLRQGRRQQDPENPVVDRALANELFRLQRYNEAAELLESIVDGPAAETAIGTEAAGRLIEVLTRLARWDDAEARLNQLSQETQDELVFRLLRASIAEGRGEVAEARRLIDAAIAAYPDAATAYMRRATSLLRDPALVRDAIEDLTRAIELDPSNITAYRLRSAAYAREGRTNESVRDVLAAVAALPDSDELRVAAARRLIELDREDEAADVIDQGLSRRAGNLALLVTGGEMFAELGRHARAAQYFGTAWEQSKDPAIGARLIRSLLEQPRPDIRQARQIANDPSLASDDVGVLMMRASVEQAAGNTAEVDRHLLAAFRIVRAERPSMIAWTLQLPSVLESFDAASSFMTRLNRSETLSPWARFAWATMLTSEERGFADALTLLAPLTAADQTAELRVQSLRLRSLVHYRQERYSEAASDMRAAVELAPNSPELLNNLAFTLAKHLGEAAEAVPLAERAVELSPDNRGTLDTLGLSYLRAGRAEESLPPLERALGLATADAEKIPVLIHLAEARLASGNPEGARAAAAEARSIVEEQPDVSEDYLGELDEVERNINAR